MMRVTGLVPARFLTMISHLVALILIIFSRSENIKSCLPEYYSPEEFKQKDDQMIVGLSIGLGLLAFELLSFVMGMTMFQSLQSLLSTCAHCGASVALAYYMFEAWPCDDYWYVFGFCSCLPAITEAFVALTALRGR